ncbi:MAG: HxsD-like protein [Candidatus Gastranaerophilaceae bacterium]|jgi:hypothetical protein
MFKIKFNKKIYSKTAINLTIGIFAHLADFKIKSDGLYFIVNIKPDKKTDIRILIDEFANYCLYLMKKS